MEFGEGIKPQDSPDKGTIWDYIGKQWDDVFVARENQLYEQELSGENLGITATSVSYDDKLTSFESVESEPRS